MKTNVEVLTSNLRKHLKSIPYHEIERVMLS